MPLPSYILIPSILIGIGIGVSWLYDEWKNRNNKP
jgi:hypothetical protein|tara:strand:+ start:97 stop:201 length:105 start_codon:yes stop_codon:yes gene_type:complete